MNDGSDSNQPDLSHLYDEERQQAERQKNEALAAAAELRRERDLARAVAVVLWKYAKSLPVMPLNTSAAAMKLAALIDLPAEQAEAIVLGAAPP